MNDSYTDEELEALPQTTQVFDAPKINLDDHVLIQQGYTIIDSCNTHPSVSFHIPSGKTLVKEGGSYKLNDEL